MGPPLEFIAVHSIAALALLCSAPGAAPEVQGPASLHAWCEPSEVRIGEPFVLYLNVEHPDEQRVLLDLPEAGAEETFGDAWVLLEPRRVLRLPLANEPERSLTQARWRLFALEPGEHELVSVGADCLLAGAVQRLEPQPAALRVHGELAEGEDLARPPLSFREAPVLAGAPRRSLLLGLAALLLLLGARWWLGALRRLLRRRPGQALQAPPTPLERLAAVDPAREGGEREAYVVLSRCLREALDGEGGERLDGLTDEEWLLARRERNGLAPERLLRVAELLATSERVKYGAERPTRWAIEQALKEARSLCAEATTREGAA
jgi:hypothetical protein